MEWGPGGNSRRALVNTPESTSGRVSKEIFVKKIQEQFLEKIFLGILSELGGILREIFKRISTVTSEGIPRGI